MAVEDRDIRLNAILAEYHTLREEMRMFLQFHRRDTYLAAVVVGGVIAFMGRTTTTLPACIYAIMPSVIFVYFMCQLINLHHVSAQAKSCKRIEQRVNKLFGNGKEIMMDWETTMAPKCVRNITSPVWLSIAGIMVFLFGLFFLCAVTAYCLYGFGLTIVHIFEFVWILVVLVRWVYFESKFDEKSI